MRLFMRMVRPIFPMVALALALAGTALLITPEPAAAQRCSLCMYRGGFECLSSPVGFERCHLGPNYCRLQRVCEELTSLQFSEDGSAVRLEKDPANPSEERRLDRTCDGVLLRARADAESRNPGSERDPLRRGGSTRDTQRHIVI